MDTLTDFIQSNELEAAVNAKAFNVAGIIARYRCTIPCRHCLFGSGPHRPGSAMGTAPCPNEVHAP